MLLCLLTPSSYQETQSLDVTKHESIGTGPNEATQRPAKTRMSLRESPQS